MIEYLGWESVFILFGGIGIFWCAVWWSLKNNGVLGGDAQLETSSEKVKNDKPASLQSIKWPVFYNCIPLRALSYAHFCNNWGSFLMLSWGPTFLSQVILIDAVFHDNIQTFSFADETLSLQILVKTLRLDLTQAAYISILPPLASGILSSIAGNVADGLINVFDVNPTYVRKSLQFLAFIVPAACLAAIVHETEYGREVNTEVIIALWTTALGFAGLSLAGLYCNHNDMSKKYSALLLGMTNTVGAVPGILGNLTTGALLGRSTFVTHLYCGCSLI